MIFKFLKTLFKPTCIINYIEGLNISRPLYIITSKYEIKEVFIKDLLINYTENYIKFYINFNEEYIDILNLNISKYLIQHNINYHYYELSLLTNTKGDFISLLYKNNIFQSKYETLNIKNNLLRDESIKILNQIK